MSDAKTIQEKLTSKDIYDVVLKSFLKAIGGGNVCPFCVKEIAEEIKRLDPTPPIILPSADEIDERDKQMANYLEAIKKGKLNA